ncbi:hypothetical protein [Quadrisphaera sp. INWT6]|uniref:hypothetical protein n=1 Tax=Quadrisphaera sp. INWT6 TaxID=2596917 RepID=UPI0018925A81|nr:hypothetical protein [Quadrisphaera sp. INWT6]MBF5082336.1 hypothetical protein [Quadrisphaera sp. INWT6]
MEILAIAKSLTSLAPALVEQLRQREAPAITVTELTMNYLRTWDLVTPQQLRLEDGPTQLNETDIRGWFVRNRAAVPAAETFLLVEVTGQTKAVTRITDLGPEVITVEDSYTGAYVLSPPAGASDVENIFFDLDKPHRGALLDLWPEEQPPNRPYFLNRSIHLGPQESVTFVVRARTDLSKVTWRLRIAYRIGGLRERTWVSKEQWTVSSAHRVSQRLLWRWWKEPRGLIREEDELL